MSKHDEFLELLQRLERQIRFLLRRWSFDPDVASEACLSLWTHFIDGVTDEDELLRRLDTDVRRYVRRETVQRSLRDGLRCAALTAREADDAERLVSSLAARQIVETLTIPDRALPWAERAAGNVARSLTPAERMHGRRWAEQTRRRLERDIA